MSQHCCGIAERGTNKSEKVTNFWLDSEKKGSLFETKEKGKFFHLSPPLDPETKLEATGEETYSSGIFDPVTGMRGRAGYKMVWKPFEYRVKKERGPRWLRPYSLAEWSFCSYDYGPLTEIHAEQAPWAIKYPDTYKSWHGKEKLREWGKGRMMFATTVSYQPEFRFWLFKQGFKKVLSFLNPNTRARVTFWWLDLSDEKADEMAEKKAA